MTPQVPNRRAVSAVTAVVIVTASLLIAVLVSSNANASASRHPSSAASSRGTLLNRWLDRLANAQGIRIRRPGGRPAPSTPSSGSAAASSSPSSSSAAGSASPSAPASSSGGSTSSAPSSSGAPSTSGAPSSGSAAGSASPSGAPSSSPSSSPTSSDPSDPSVAGDTLVWSDEFNGSAGAIANPSTWNYNTGGAWGSHELECYENSANNASTNGRGDLVITARYAPNTSCPGGTTNQYTSARLTTQGLAAAQYGAIRVRAKVPSASGVWPAIWLLGDNINQVGWPACGEIDMMEAVGQNNTTIYGTVHGGTSSGSAWQIGSGNGYTLSSPMNDNFHIYGLDWSPSKMVLSIDGHAYVTITKADVEAQGGQWVFNQRFFILLNVAVGGDWPGAPKDNSVFPQSMTVDYVRVYN